MNVAAPSSVDGQFAALRAAAARGDAGALGEAAVQFEALFIGMMLKSARAASLGDGLFDGGDTQQYLEMMDAQVALDIARRGGFGFGRMLLEQLGGGDVRTGAPSAHDAESVSRLQPLAGPADQRTASPAAARFLPESLAAASAAMLDAAAAGNDIDSSAAVGAADLRGFAAALAAPRTASASGAAAAARAAGTAGANATTAAPTAGAPRLTMQERSAGAAAGTAAGTTPAAARAGASTADRARFVAELLPHAQRAAERLGVDPRLLIAQAALETGWGAAVPRGPDGRSTHNLFGIKAGSSWRGEKAAAWTLESVDGLPERRRAEFRAYRSAAESFADYANVIERAPRYAEARRHAADPESYARALADAGYATDPAYAAKWLAVYRSDAITTAQPGSPVAQESRPEADNGSVTAALVASPPRLIGGAAGGGNSDRVVTAWMD